MIDISVIVGGSVFLPDSFSFSSGLSLVYLYPPSSKIGLAFNPIKLSCAECNTPIGEIAAGSLIIRSKHHGSRHTTVLSKRDLIRLL